jgi:hypothetical protein
MQAIGYRIAKDYFFTALNKEDFTSGKGDRKEGGVYFFFFAEKMWNRNLHVRPYQKRYHGGERRI